MSTVPQVDQLTSAQLLDLFLADPTNARFQCPEAKAMGCYFPFPETLVVSSGPSNAFYDNGCHKCVINRRVWFTIHYDVKTQEYTLSCNMQTVPDADRNKCCLACAGEFDTPVTTQRFVC
jgi:hypothetical protein